MRSPVLPLQNLSESIRLVIFDHVRSYILIIRRISHAILYIPRNLSFFGCRRGYIEERVDPGRRIQIFLNFYIDNICSRRFMHSPELPRKKPKRYK